jgi:hypothetical protein
LFTFLVFLHLPLALLCAVLIYAGLIGSISGAELYGFEFMAWFERSKVFLEWMKAVPFRHAF